MHNVSFKFVKENFLENRIPLMLNRNFAALFAVTVFLLLSSPKPAVCGDWPMWRYNARRGAATPDALPEQIHLQWVRELSKQRTAWPATQTKLQFDRSYEPVVMGRQLFVGSTVNDSITAYSTESGDQLWRFYTNGPVRFAPVALEGRVYAVSDDGYLYCLDVVNGKLLWKVNGGPTDREIIGNGRLVSSWTARGGPVVDDGVVYFTAGIWPSMGIFIHAVDAQNGRILWTNSETGSEFTVHPHRASSFGSVVPQGYLAVSGNYLIVPGGRSLPAVLDLKTGKVVHFQFGGKSSGGFAVTAAEQFFVVGGDIFRLDNGDELASAEIKVISNDLVIGNRNRNKTIVVHPLSNSIQETTITDKRGRREKKLAYRPKQIKSVSFDDTAPTNVWLRSGNRIFTGDVNRVAAFELMTKDDDSRNATSLQQKPVWNARVNGTIGSMLAADDKLFVVTEEGRIYCFGKEQREPKRHHLTPARFSGLENPEIEQAKTIIEATGVEKRNENREPGYSIIFGAGSPDDVLELSSMVNYHLRVLDPHPNTVDRFRKHADFTGIYGKDVTATLGTPKKHSLPPYLASLIVCDDMPAAEFDFSRECLSSVYQLLRPYGGVACLKMSGDEHTAFAKSVRAAKLPGAQVTRRGEYTLLRRVGALPGSGSWTHQYGDATNSVVSKDNLVKVPLGVLWFGGPSNDKILPRHGHGPSPQVAGGRLFIEGLDILRAVDVYTGRLLWEKEIKGIGSYYNTTRHFPGAGEIGSNYVSKEDSVYAVYGSKILDLDAATGEKKKEFVLQSADGTKPPNWGFIAVYGDYLVATSTPLEVNKDVGNSKKKGAVVPVEFEPLINPNARWRYLAGSDPQENWTTIGFDDSTWKSGKAGFGYGDGDDRTVLENMRGKFTRVYLRRNFDAGTAAVAESLVLMVNFDDAFIAYLNGKEIARHNINGRSGRNARLSGRHEAAGHEVYAIRNFQKLLKGARNVLAIEGHNRSIRSSDFTLDPFLLFKPTRKNNHPIVLVKNQIPVEENSASAGDAFKPVSYSSASKQLAVLNRHTGKLLWKREARFSFRHNCIVAADGKVFCIDGLSPVKVQTLKRRGIDATGKSRLLALDVKTGREIWSSDQDVTGTFLNYSDTYDVLLQAGSAYRDRASDEVDLGMVTYRGSDGKLLWKNLGIKYSGPCLLWRDKIITNGGGGFQLDLRSGKQTGWTYSREYGCNTAIGSEHLITFRSGAAGFCDLSGDSGTGNIGGFRSSCTSNLIAADGVLNAPDYTRTCSCAYQNQTSLALIHMPEAELWTFNKIQGNQQSFKQFGLNFGAPGDRRGPNSTLWLDYPTVGGPSPNIDVTVTPKEPEWFRRHSSQLHGEGLNWIAASGGKGIESVTLKLASQSGTARSYTIRLHFSEPDEVKSGERVFSVTLQNQTVLKHFDIVKEAGGSHRAVIKEFTGVSAEADVLLKLIPDETSRLKPVLCGMEVVAE
jgi:outer membrane protein assembly factor BamB